MEFNCRKDSQLLIVGTRDDEALDCEVVEKQQNFESGGLKDDGDVFPAAIHVTEC